MPRSSSKYGHTHKAVASTKLLLPSDYAVGVIVDIETEFEDRTHA